MVWLSYGCSIGASSPRGSVHSRQALRLLRDVPFIKPDDAIEILIDNEVPSVARADVIDPKYDTVSRTQTPAYKQGRSC